MQNEKVSGLRPVARMFYHFDISRTIISRIIKNIARTAMTTLFKL